MQRFLAITCHIQVSQGRLAALEASIRQGFPHCRLRLGLRPGLHKPEPVRIMCRHPASMVAALDFGRAAMNRVTLTGIGTPTKTGKSWRPSLATSWRSRRSSPMTSRWRVLGLRLISILDRHQPRWRPPLAKPLTATRTRRRREIAAIAFPIMLVGEIAYRARSPLAA